MKNHNYKDALIKTHRAAHRPGTWRTDLEDYPENKKLFLQFQPAWCKKEATRMGEFAGKFVDEILAPHALVNLRKAQAVIRLGEKHGANKLDDICRYLLANGSTRHSSVKRLLEQGIPQVPTAPTPPPISDAGRELLHPANSFGEVSL